MTSPADPFRVDGKVAVVTGGSRGIGHAIARSLTHSGAHVVICGRDRERGAAAAAELDGLAGKVEFARADVTDEDDVRGLVEACDDLFGPMSILVNNAGPTDLLHTRTVDGQSPASRWTTGTAFSRAH